MKTKIFAAIALSSLCMSNAYCGDFVDALGVVGNILTKQVNVAAGVNTGSKGDFSAEADGKGSVANAGVGVMTNTGKVSAVNVALGVNTGDSLKLKAKATGGGVANAGVGVMTNN